MSYGAKGPGSQITTDYLLSYIRQNHGLTAWQLAKRLGVDPAGLSSRLKKLTDQGKLQRIPHQTENGRESWQYYGVR
jgi:DNA-binding MarR family transcriptional regulator